VRLPGRILDVDQSVSGRWGQIAALDNRPLPVMDELMAANAPEHNLIFVNRNVKDVGTTAVSMFNPWNS
jgi:predicted nucleic acid-binding protein